MVAENLVLMEHAGVMEDEVARVMENVRQEAIADTPDGGNLASVTAHYMVDALHTVSKIRDRLHYSGAHREANRYGVLIRAMDEEIDRALTKADER